MRTIRHGIDPSVIVRARDGIEIAVPCWMLDAHQCAALMEEASPRVSIPSLLALADLIDVHRDELADTSGSSPQPGASDEAEVFPCAPSSTSPV